jgi:predicted nucleic acid-binding protein
MSAQPVVLDASAAIAMVRREPAGPIVLESLRASASTKSRLLVPDPFWLELVNVLVRRYSLRSNEVLEAVRDMDDFGLESIRIDRPLLLVSIDLQSRFEMSGYDAVYLALAETEDARLLTLDHGLASAAGSRAVDLPGLSRARISEQRAAYGEPIDWAQLGPYLARLRSEVREALEA